MNYSKDDMQKASIVRILQADSSIGTNYVNRDSWGRIYKDEGIAYHKIQDIHSTSINELKNKYKSILVFQANTSQIKTQQNNDKRNFADLKAHFYVKRSEIMEGRAIGLVGDVLKSDNKGVLFIGILQDKSPQTDRQIRVIQSFCAFLKKKYVGEIQILNPDGTAFGGGGLFMDKNMSESYKKDFKVAVDYIKELLNGFDVVKYLDDLAKNKFRVLTIIPCNALEDEDGNVFRPFPGVAKEVRIELLREVYQGKRSALQLGIFWDSRAGLKGYNGGDESLPPFVTLFHEMVHAARFIIDSQKALQDVTHTYMVEDGDFEGRANYENKEEYEVIVKYERFLVEKLNKVREAEGLPMLQIRYSHKGVAFHTKGSLSIDRE